MTFESEKSGQHLRQQFLAQNTKERMTTIQALSASYLGDSRAIVSGLLLSALGGSLPAHCNRKTQTAIEQSLGMPQASTATIAVTQVTESMQSSANDEAYEQEQACLMTSQGTSA